jgi:hypothetical protein
LDWAWLADPQGVFEAMAAILMILVAATVFLIKPGQRAHQAFALFFTFRGIAMLGAVGGDKAAPETATLLVTFAAYVVTAIPLSLAWFVSVYPEPRGPASWRRAGPWLLIGIGVVVDGLFLADHRIIASDFSNFRSLSTHLTLFGAIWYNALYASIAMAAVWFTWLYATSPMGRRCRSLFYVMLAFVVHSAYDGVTVLFGATFPHIEAASWGSFLGVPATLAAAGILAWGGARRTDPARRRDVAVFVAVVFLSVLVHAITKWTGLGDKGWDFADAGFSRLISACLVAYALSRRHLLEIDVAIKWTIKRGTVVAILVAAFFVASQLAQALLPGLLGGPIVGGVVVGLLLFAIAPLQRFAEQVSEKAMPHAKHLSELAHGEREAIYLDMARTAWKDGTIDKRERALLRHLQHRLGLPADVAQELETRALDA